MLGAKKAVRGPQHPTPLSAHVKSWEEEVGEEEDPRLRSASVSDHWNQTGPSVSAQRPPSATATRPTLTPSLSVTSAQPQRATSPAEKRISYRRRLTADMSSKSKKKPTIALHLTPHQISQVQTIWNNLKTAKGPSTVGTSVWQRVCFKCPQIREIIFSIPPSNIPPEFGDAERLHREHGLHVFRLLDELISRLDEPAGAAEFLTTAGRKHTPFHQFGFTPTFWNTFAEAFIDLTLEWGDKSQRKEDTRMAWAVIINAVVERLKGGYTEQRRRSSFREPPASAAPRPPPPPSTS